MSLADIVKVNITKETLGIPQANFGILLVLTYHNRFVGRAQEFTDPTSMLTANGGPFESTDLAYIIANKAFSQSPRIDKVVIGRRGNAPLRTVTVTPLSGTISGDSYPLPNTDYIVEINGVEFKYTTDATPTVAEITAGLVALINAGSENVLATDNTTDFEVESADAPGGSATAGAPFTISRDRKLMSLHDDTTDPGVAADIAAVRNVNDSWYGIAGDWYGEDEIEAVADTIEALRKIHGAVTQDDDTMDPGSTTDIGSVLAAKGYARTFLFHHPNEAESANAADFGKNFVYDPGSITWMFKTLAGVTAIEYTPTERTELQKRNMERYILRGGVGMTEEGKTLGGEYIDITRFVDWMQARMEENIFRTLKVSGKVPFTQKGISQIANEVWGVINQGVSNGGLAENSEVTPITVTEPTLAQIPANNKANRLLSPGTKFRATLAGAIHEVEIDGTVTV